MGLANDARHASTIFVVKQAEVHLISLCWNAAASPSPKNLVHVMKNRPLPIVITALIFIITGFVGIVYHANEYFEPTSIKVELVWILFIRVLAIVCGLLLLRGVNWARWLAIAWLVYHVAIGALNSTSQMVAHIVILVIVSFLLFMPKSSAYFRNGPGNT